MMNKEVLINQVIAILDKSDFIISERCNIRPRSFDIAARRQDKLVLIKVLSNIDGLKEDTAYEMIFLAEYLSGAPLIVGEKTRDHPIESNVVYYRYGIPSINIDTLYDYFIEETPPLVYAAPGGLYVSVDGSILKDMRRFSNLSLGALAAELGVSRRAISKYEEEGMDMSVDMVIRIEELFNQAIALAIDLLTVRISKDIPLPTQTEPGISIKYLLSSLGCEVIPISQAPFNAVSVEQNKKHDQVPTILTGLSNYSGAMIKRAKLMSSISEVTGTKSMFIVDGPCKSECVNKTVLVEKSELESMEDFSDLLIYIQKRAQKN